MYTFDSRIRYSETGEGGYLTLPALVNYFQDCSTFQSEAIGLGVEYLLAEKRAWMLSSWQIEIARYPKLGEKVTVGTAAYQLKSIFGLRNFAMMDPDGGYLVKANSVWVFMNLESGRPVRIDEENLKGYPIEQPLDMKCDSRKIELPDTWTALEPFPVRKHNLDSNEHVNNAQYVMMAEELLENRSPIRKLRVEYRRQARLGDVIYPMTGQKDGADIVSLNSEDGSPYAVLSMERAQARA